MTPPEVSVEGTRAEPERAPPAVFPCLTVISNRSDFLRAAQALRQGTPAFLLQARRRADAETCTGIRIGYTCSKKVGNAVARNRAKRRLREIARATLPEMGKDGWDYVLVGRPDLTASRAFDVMKADLARALQQIHSGKAARR